VDIILKAIKRNEAVVTAEVRKKLPSSKKRGRRLSPRRGKITIFLSLPKGLK
jgi:hypothetical protein